MTKKDEATRKLVVDLPPHMKDFVKKMALDRGLTVRAVVQEMILERMQKRED